MTEKKIWGYETPALTLQYKIQCNYGNGVSALYFLDYKNEEDRKRAKIFYRNLLSTDPKATISLGNKTFTLKDLEKLP